MPYRKLAGGGGGGGVSTVSVSSVHGFAGTVTNATTTPAIALSTTVSAGLVKSDGGSPGSLVAAVAGTDYQAAVSVAANSVLVNNTTSPASPVSAQTMTLGTAGYVASGVAIQQTGNGGGGTLQWSLQNTGSTSSDSTDVVLTANGGSDTTRYVDLGINSTAGGAAPFTGALAAYCYTTEAALSIGALGTSGAVTIYTAGGIATPTLAATFSATNLTVVGTIAAGNLSLANTFTTSGNFTTTVTTTATTAVTLPTSGTLAALGGTNAWSGQATFSAANTQGSSAVAVTSGTWFVSGGATGTNTTPMMYINGGTAPSTWSLNGTGLGINMPSGSTGNAIDVHLNGGGSIFSVASTGAVTVAGITSTVSFSVTATGSYVFLTRSKLTSPADGKFLLQNNGATAFTSLQFAGTTSANPMIKVNGAAFNFRVGDDSADCAVTCAALTMSGLPKFGGTNSTGAGSALLGANSPAVTNTSPYTWISATSSDGSAVFIPCWK